MSKNKHLEKLFSWSKFADKQSASSSLFISILLELLLYSNILVDKLKLFFGFENSCLETSMEFLLLIHIIYSCDLSN